MINLNDEIDPDDMPVCPLCDEPILKNDETCIIFAHECKVLAHMMCVNYEGD